MKGCPSPSQLWAKLDRDEEGVAQAWHPLECHLADVAACTWALLSKTILRRRFGALLGRELTDVDIARLTFLAAAHDLGKVNHGFQGQAQPNAKARAGHVSPLIDAFDTSVPDETTNKFIVALRLEEILVWFEDDTQLLEWILATLAHHGRAVRPTARFNREHWEPREGHDPFAEMATLVTTLRSWVPEAFTPHAPPFRRDTRLQHTFNGLLTFADWLGSDTRFFPYADQIDGRFEWAQHRAIEALTQTGICVDGARQQLAESELNFQSFTGFDSPNDLQQKCLELETHAPGLVVVESDTGSGKTEAAFARFAALFQAGEVDGMYFALPTRSAATQMFERVRAMTARLFPDESTRPPVVMAVPGYIAVDDANAIRLPGFKVQWPDDAADRMRYRGWAAESSKRYLAGTIVVGTIDQALLSVLQVKHAHLRSSALLRHLLVIDEVHASDAYMTRLTQSVLDVQLASKGHVFLMSATLGNATLARYFERPELSFNAASREPYPCIHAKLGENTVQMACASSGYDKTVAMELAALAGDDVALAQRVKVAVQAGARVLIIRNTVSDCVATFKAVEDLVPDALMRVGGVSAPHHGRYAKADRTTLDRAVEGALGRTSERGVVVVATQTVEQSLDIDADLLITDLCPVDVLLQRIGRLHRHPKRDRIAGFEQARAVVLTPQDPLASIIKPDKVFGPHGIGTVYPDLAVLEATRRLVQGVWTIPAMNRELVETALHPDQLAALCDELGVVWQQHRQSQLGSHAASTTIANLNRINRDKPFYECPTADADERIQTRLGEGDRRVMFTPTRGPFGQTLQDLRIPHTLARKANASPDDVEVEVLAFDGGFSFDWGGCNYIYDRLGLRLNS